MINRYSKQYVRERAKKYYARQKSKGWKMRSIMANDELWEQIKKVRAMYKLQSVIQHNTDEGEAD